MDRIFSSLKLKTVDEDQRIVEGWATTPAQDRAGDIVDPLGAEFDLERRPIPFLFDHDYTQAVGEIEAAEVTSRGIRFRARIFKIARPGLAKDFLDQAWDLLRVGARKSVSIGFRALNWDPLPAGGTRFTQWEWLELSACAVPCNAEAQITGLKRAGDTIGRSADGSRLRLPIVTLDDKSRRIGKIKAAADRRSETRQLLGLPAAVVKLDPLALYSAREQIRREKAAERERRSRKVRVIRA